MNFIITENKLERIIFKYLDNQNLIIKKQPMGNIVFVYSEDDDKAQIVYHKEKNVIGVLSPLRREIQDFFSITKTESTDLIGDWAQNKLNLDYTPRINLPFILVLPNEE